MRVWEYINLVGEYRNESICLLPTTGWCFSFSDRKKKQKKKPKYKREHFTLTEPNKQEQVLARATSPPGLQMKNPTSTQSIIYLNYTRYLYHCVNMTVATRKAETKSKKFYFCQKNCTFPLPFHWHLGSLDMSSVTSWHSLQYEHATAGAWATAGNTTSQRWMKKKRREKNVSAPRNIDCVLLFSIGRLMSLEWISVREETFTNNMENKNVTLTF